MARKSKTKLFETLLDLSIRKRTQFGFLAGVKSLGLEHVHISNETYGRNSHIYIHTHDTEIRRVLERELTDNGYQINRAYYPGSGTVEVTVSFFKGFNWDE